MPVQGNRRDDALAVPGEAGMQTLPKPEARALVSYLLNLRKDDALPASMTPPVEGAAPEPDA